MSRILQALKQLENRPVTEPIAPTPANASQSELPNARLPTMPFVPTAQQKPVERISPRRKKRKAKRAATAEQAQQQLASAKNSVIECWSDSTAEVQLFVEGIDSADTAQSSPGVVVNSQLPTVVTVREPVQHLHSPLVEFAPCVIEHWSPIEPTASVVVHQSPVSGLSTPSVTASGYAPQIIHTAENARLLHEQALALITGPSVIEAWSIAEPSTPVIVEDASDVSHVVPTASVITNDQLPQVMVVHEYAESETPTVSLPLAEASVEARTQKLIDDLQTLLASVSPTIVENWSPSAMPEAVVVDEAGFGHTVHATSVVASDYAPTIIAIREQPSDTDAPRERLVTEVIPRRVQPEVAVPANLTADEVHSLLGEAAPAVIESWPQQPSDDSKVIAAEAAAPTPAEAAEPEVDLQFRRAPRRRERRVITALAPGRERRQTAQPDRRELEVRKLVRGQRATRPVTISAWESEISRRLRQPALAASYRQLVSRWQVEHREHDLNTLLIASLGSPQIAAEVALAAAKLLVETPETEVLIIDADEGRYISQQLDIAGMAGLTDLLAPHDAHGETIYPLAQPQISVLPWGRCSGATIGPGKKFDALLHDLSQEYAWIIVAGGKIDATLTTLLARTCHGTYLIAPLGEVDVPTARHSIDTLRSAGARVLGSMVVEFGS